MISAALGPSRCAPRMRPVPSSISTFRARACAACRQPIGPGELQRRRDGAGGDQHAAPDQAIVADGEGGRVDEARAPVKLLDADLCRRLLGTLRRRVDQRPLEAHEGGPVDRQRAGRHADVAHVPHVMDRLGRPHQDLFGNATAQRTGAVTPVPTTTRSKRRSIPASSRTWMPSRALRP